MSILSKSINTGIPTPQRRRKAIKLVYDDEEYSDHEASDIMVLFAKDVAFADTYADIPVKAGRVRFIRNSLAAFNA